MSDHIHLFLRVPGNPVVPDTELVERAAQFYGEKSGFVRTLREALGTSESLPEDLRTGLLARMGDISVFMKELKQRFSKWYNKQHNRFGTLWAERFRSLLVEDQPGPVQAMAAYVVLNPVRAGLVTDPKDYRWSDYGEAVAGQELARRGLASFHPSVDWTCVGAAYRQVLMVKAGRGGQPGNSGGALVDARGNVVGVVTTKLDARAALSTSGALPENVNYAVKSSLLLSFLESVPEVSTQLREPNSKDLKFEDMVKAVEQAAALVLVC